METFEIGAYCFAFMCVGCLCVFLFRFVLHRVDLAQLVLRFPAVWSFPFRLCLHKFSQIKTMPFKVPQLQGFLISTRNDHNYCFLTLGGCCVYFIYFSPSTGPQCFLSHDYSASNHSSFKISRK